MFTYTPKPHEPSRFFVDFTATGAEPSICHKDASGNVVFAITGDGEAWFGGAIDIAAPLISPPLIDAYQQFHTPGLAHGMTALVPTDVSGLITYQSAAEGGLNLIGFNAPGTNVPALVLQGVVGDVGGLNQPMVHIEGWKASGTGRVAASGTDIILAVCAGATPVFLVGPNGLAPVVSGGFGTPLGPSSNGYTGLMGQGGPGAIGTASAACPRGGRLIKLYITLTSAQGPSGTLVFTIYKNGVATALTVTFNANDGAGTVRSDITHAAAVAAGDTVAVYVVNNDTIANSATANYTVTYDT